MASLAPPISIHLTRRQLRWLDSRRLRSSLSRSAALREAIDALIQQEEGSGRPGGSSGSGQAATAPRHLELTSQAAAKSPAQAEPTTRTEA
jgi:metal-responsive CopG/Arc/MetJ family transcriptional regulator